MAHNFKFSLIPLLKREFLSFLFTPKTEGEKSAHIEITFNDPETPILTVSLDVTVGGSYRLMAMPLAPILLLGE